MVASETELKWRAMRLGELAAIRSEEYAVTHQEEIARRRLFFRRLLEENRWRGRAEVGVDANRDWVESWYGQSVLSV